MKSRGVYETPAGTVVRAAHRALEQLVPDRRTLDLQDQLAPRYADMLYKGRWWSAERAAFDALTDVTQQPVVGTAEVKLFKGTVTVQSRQSPFSLYSAEHVTFGAADVYDQVDATGFTNLFGLLLRIASQVRQLQSATASLQGTTSEFVPAADRDAAERRSLGHGT
ncbi:MAG: hypothetical protein AMS18_10650 [Gemmatimonas sp. SG8_17]|nr:MAG: hypothetical protein AMS18_10650 [Gemmatimonas sp. SG8_17]